MLQLVAGLAIAVSALGVQDKGLAARYPGDRGIGTDPAVLLAADFSEPTVEAIVEQWDDVGNPNGAVLSLSAEGLEAASGKQCIQLTAHPGQDNGGQLYKRLPRDIDEMYLRFYVQFPEPPGYVHHFVHLGGYYPATRWPQGHAGEKPAGNERITVGIEPFGRDGTVPPPGEWNFYTYWMDMKGSADGRYWGNGISPEQAAAVPVGRWQCVEVRLRLNTPGEPDGVLALWLDGKPVMDVHQGSPIGEWTGEGFRLGQPGATPFPGFRFRSDARLKLNFISLLHYVTETNQARNHVADRTRPVVVRFDQVVVATRYIGPIAPADNPTE